MNPHRYLKTQKTGEGTYGVVYKGLDTINNEIVALKKFKYDPLREGISTNALREISYLNALNHPNIIKIKDQVILNTRLHLVLDFYEYSLSDLLNQVFNSQQIQLITEQILSAIKCCHENDIIHRDICPENIMINKETYTPILIDFGMARVCKIKNQLLTYDVSHLWYKAPELLKNEQSSYTKAVDMWSVGCVFAELLNKKPLFLGSCQHEQFHIIQQKLETNTLEDLTQSAGLSPEFGDLLKHLLTIEPESRMTVQDALIHPYFQVAKSDFLSQ